MILYNICIVIYSLLIKIASIKIPKAKYWCDGRKDIFERLKKSILPTDRIVWIHAASLGEFEQGLPIIEYIHENHPEYKILLTFFSPSGYETRKNYSGVDYVFYLPIDTTNNAREFLNIVKPEIAIFVKYEFWLNLLFELRSRKIRSYIVSAIFRPQSVFFKWWGFMWRNALKSFETIFVQDKSSQERLAKIGFSNVVVAGDTRFDRVLKIAQSAKTLPLIEQFKGDGDLFIAGSTWPQDEQILKVLAQNNSNIKFVIAPHEIDERHILDIERLFGDSTIRYSQVVSNDTQGIATAISGHQILILDTMGMLSSTYQYGNWAYIGGGFGVGIHNTLEASTFALPIAFGPNYTRFKEACDMVSIGAATSVNNAEELGSWFAPLVEDREYLAKVSNLAKEFTTKSAGATSIISCSIFNR